MDSTTRYQMIVRYEQRQKELDRLRNPTQEQAGESIAIDEILYLLRHAPLSTWKGQVEMRILTWPEAWLGRHDEYGQTYDVLKRSYDKTLGDWLWEVIQHQEEEKA